MHICIHLGFLLEINFVFCACICLSFYAIIALSHYCFFSWYAIPKELVDNITPMSDQNKKTHKNGTVRFKTDNNWWNLCGIKYFATANPSKTKRNIVNIKQLSIVRTWHYYSRWFVLTSTNLKKICLSRI